MLYSRNPLQKSSETIPTFKSHVNTLLSISSLSTTSVDGGDGIRAYFKLKTWDNSLGIDPTRQGYQARQICGCTHTSRWTEDISGKEGSPCYWYCLSTQDRSPVVEIARVLLKLSLRTRLLDAEFDGVAGSALECNCEVIEWVGIWTNSSPGIAGSKE